MYRWRKTKWIMDLCIWSVPLLDIHYLQQQQYHHVDIPSFYIYIYLYIIVNNNKYHTLYTWILIILYVSKYLYHLII